MNPEKAFAKLTEAEIIALPARPQLEAKRQPW
jgi:hypothetical protein